MTWLRGHAQLIAITCVIFALWNTPVVWPLKILVVLFHEISHGLAAAATGGSIASLSVAGNEGGVAWTRGGNPAAIAMAGYLGSLVIGIALLIAAIRSDADRFVAGLTGGIVLFLTALYIRDSFAMIFAISTGAILLASARFAPQDVTDLLLRVIGLASMIYAPYDIISDTILRDFADSDAANIARQFGGTATLWGWIWLAISAALIAASLRWGLGRDSNIRLRR